MLKKIRIINDFSAKQYNSRAAVNDYVNKYTNLTLSYLIMLLCSVIICSLGLLINSSPVVIGGMIIAPLMLPLIKLSYGLSRQRTGIMRDALIMLGLSILVTYFVAILVTLATPIKAITPEILARSTPTTVELFIAFTVGVIAALATIHSRIGGTFAGIAIAISLIPPLCASAIAIVLGDFQVARGAALLFGSNAIGIILVCTIIFSAFVHKNLAASVFTKHFAIVIMVVVITLLPLYGQLTRVIEESRIYLQAQQILKNDIDRMRPGSVVKDITQRIDTKRKNLVISGTVLISQTDTITHDDLSTIEKSLTKKTGYDVQLQMMFQNTASLANKTDVEQLRTAKKIESYFESAVSEDYSFGAVISDLNAFQEKNHKYWIIHATLLVNDPLLFTLSSESDMEQRISKKIDIPVKINLQIIQSVSIGQYANTTSAVNQEIITAIKEVQPSANIVGISNIRLANTPITINIRMPRSSAIDEESYIRIRDAIQKITNSSNQIVLKVTLFDIWQ